MTESSGLSAAVARERLARVGFNELPSQDRRSIGRLAWNVIREPMLVLLLCATALYLVFGDHVEAIALGVSVLAIVAITLLQEQRTEHALDALRDLARPRARVLRDGSWREIDARELVPGDIVHVGEGDRAPADTLLRSGTPLTIDESLLTGESVPVLRTPDVTASMLGRPGEEGAAVFAGTLVTSGNATAEVIETGERTQVGRIGAALGAIELARAPLHREVSHVVRRIAVVAGATCVALVAVYLIARHGVLQAGLAGISLAMSLLPEELPLVLAIFLTLGAWRMTKHRVLARRAAAIETLGAVTVLCVDKTGTLTVNRMEIRRIVTSIVHSVDPGATTLPETSHEAVEFGLLACPRQTTDAMDRAFANLARQALGATEHVHPDWEWVREYPLSPGLLAVTHAWRAGGGRTVVATKGAPEAIFDLCRLDPSTRADWSRRAQLMAADGLRVIGVARAKHLGDGVLADPRDYAFDLVGLVGLNDPLRDDTAATISTCREAGVRVIMITGDHAVTAGAIGAELGLGGGAVSGADLKQMSDEELSRRLPELHVFGRVTPDDKLRLVGLLQAKGAIVAMTGDAVNDAAAIKQANIGVAMGSGSEVTKQAAKLVLTDDNFATLVHAVELGRIVYSKITAYLRFQMTQLLSLIILFLAASAFSIAEGVALFPAQVLFLNFFVALFAVIAIAADANPPGIMNHPPRDPRIGVVNPVSLIEWLVYGVVIFLIALVPLVWGPDEPSPTTPTASMTMAYVVLGLATVLSALLMRRSPESGLVPPIWAVAKILVWPVLLIVASTEVGLLQRFLGTVSLTGFQWLECIGLTLILLVVVEGDKWIRRRRPASRQLGRRVATVASH